MTLVSSILCLAFLALSGIMASPVLLIFALVFGLLAMNRYFTGRRGF